MKRTFSALTVAVLGAGLALVGTVAPAAASTPAVSASCVSLDVNLSGYATEPGAPAVTEQRVVTPAVAEVSHTDYVYKRLVNWSETHVSHNWVGLDVVYDWKYYVFTGETQKHIDVPAQPEVDRDRRADPRGPGEPDAQHRHGRGRRRRAREHRIRRVVHAELPARQVQRAALHGHRLVVRRRRRRRLRGHLARLRPGRLERERDHHVVVRLGRRRRHQRGARGEPDQRHVLRRRLRRRHGCEVPRPRRGRDHVGDADLRRGLGRAHGRRAHRPRPRRRRARARHGVDRLRREPRRDRADGRHPRRVGRAQARRLDHRERHRLRAEHRPRPPAALDAAGARHGHDRRERRLHPREDRARLDARRRPPRGRVPDRRRGHAHARHAHRGLRRDRRGADRPRRPGHPVGTGADRAGRGVRPRQPRRATSPRPASTVRPSS